MSKKLIKPLVLILVFIGALITFSILTNKDNTDMTSSMEEATLPVMSFRYNNQTINCLYGYTQEMQLNSATELLTPIGNDRKINIHIDTDGMTIDRITYQIRSREDRRLIVENEVKNYSVENGYIDAEVTLESILKENEQYYMMFCLEAGERTIYYYTRVIRENNMGVERYMNFAKQFHDETFNKNSTGFFPLYIDPTTGNTSTLNYVDLTCSIRQLTWNKFEGTVVGDLKYAIKELNDSYFTVVVSYVLTSNNVSGQSEYFNVEEYHRLRYVNDRMYVLNFERRMNQIFRSDRDFIYNKNSIQLGIRNEAVEYDTNVTGDVIAFVQEGELWSYNVPTNTLSKVFSFRGLEGIDDRENNPSHAIRILRVDEAGSVDFMVYGYMNRGEHEGEVGVSLYHYDGLAHNIEEEVYIASTLSYASLKEQIGQLMYENDKNHLFFMMNENLYKIALSDLSYEVVVSGLQAGTYAVSENNRCFAWVNPENANSSSWINFMDLQEEKQIKIDGEEGQCLKPLAFMKNDFIYGIANEQEITEAEDGNTIFPIHTVRIISGENEEHEIIKEYVPNGAYVQSANTDKYVVTLTLFRPENGAYVSAGTDRIMNREIADEKNTSVTTTLTDVKETEVQLALSTTPKTTSVKVVTPKLVKKSFVPVVELTKNDDGNE